MKKNSGSAIGYIVLFLIFLIVVASLCYIFLLFNRMRAKDTIEQNDFNIELNNQEEYVSIESQNKYEKFEFDTAYGEVIIEAEKALTGRGTAGATNNIFYLKDAKLYLYSNDGEDELLADGVEDIYYEDDISDVISVKLNNDSTKSVKNGYIEYIR